jgi:hypothetical protein
MNRNAAIDLMRDVCMTREQREAYEFLTMPPDTTEPVAWMYTVGERKEVIFRYFPQNELVDGCFVTPLHTHPINLAERDALVGRIIEKQDWRFKLSNPHISELLTDIKKYLEAL